MEDRTHSLSIEIQRKDQAPSPVKASPVQCKMAAQLRYRGVCDEKCGGVHLVGWMPPARKFVAKQFNSHSRMQLMCNETDGYWHFAGGLLELEVDAPATCVSGGHPASPLKARTIG